jgi:hypothetical protein
MGPTDGSPASAVTQGIQLELAINLPTVACRQEMQNSLLHIKCVDDAVIAHAQAMSIRACEPKNTYICEERAYWCKTREILLFVEREDEAWRYQISEVFRPSL